MQSLGLILREVICVLVRCGTVAMEATVEIIKMKCFPGEEVRSNIQNTSRVWLLDGEKEVKHAP